MLSSTPFRSSSLVLLGNISSSGVALTRGKGILNGGDTVVFPAHRLANSAAKQANVSRSSSSAKKNKKRKLSHSVQTSGSIPVRFYAQHNQDGLELGKIDSDLGDMLSPLMIEGMIEVLGSIVYSPETIYPGAKIYIELKIYLNPGRLVRKQRSEETELPTELDRSFFALLNHLKLISVDGNLVNASSGNSEKQNSGRVGLESFNLDKLLTENEIKVLELPESQVNNAFFYAKLRSYQKQALGWMVKREDGAHQLVDENRLHPMWTQIDLPGGAVLYANAYTLRASMDFQSTTPAASGGLLADQMGMGKTIEALAMICQQKHNDLQISAENHAATHNWQTLIVCTTSLLAQWQDEIMDHSDLTAARFYGSGRQFSCPIENVSASIPNHDDFVDVILTTYGTMSSEFSANLPGSPLFSTTWRRVILDEAHFIKNKNTGYAKCAFALNAKSRWALTGTPIQNKIDDIHSIESPWDETRIWNELVAKPLEKQNPVGLRRLHAILQPLMLRRTKEMRDLSGKQLVSLPPITKEDILVEFTEKERQLYDAIYKRSRQKFQGLVDQGIILNRYVHVLELLLRMRQVCNHYFLIVGKRQDSEDVNKEVENIMTDLISRSDLDPSSQSFVKHLSNELIENAGKHECPICLDSIEAPVISNCGHLFCEECVNRMFAQRKECFCPMCRQSLLRRNFKRCNLGQGPQMDFDTDWKHSSKTSRLIDLLNGFEKDTKTVVFSQWTSMLDLCEIAFRKSGIRYVRLDGSMTQKARETSVNQFSEDNSGIQVMLISLKAGGVGLNLVAASNVVLLDCWWNPAVDNQAIDRVHRIGQERPVQVRRLVVKETVEERILELQQRKNELARGALNAEDQGGSSLQLEDLNLLFESF